MITSATICPPGLAPPPGCPSHGSALHALGKCKACSWFWRASGCRNGEACQHCHLCPKSEVKARKCRMRGQKQRQQQQQDRGASREESAPKLKFSSADLSDLDESSTRDCSELDETLSAHSQESAEPSNLETVWGGLRRLQQPTQPLLRSSRAGGAPWLESMPGSRYSSRRACSMARAQRHHLACSPHERSMAKETSAWGRRQTTGVSSGKHG